MSNSHADPDPRKRPPRYYHSPSALRAGPLRPDKVSALRGVAHLGPAFAAPRLPASLALQHDLPWFRPPGDDEEATAVAQEGRPSVRAGQFVPAPHFGRRRRAASTSQSLLLRVRARATAIALPCLGSCRNMHGQRDGWVGYAADLI